MKMCTKCRELKPLGEFYALKNGADGLAARCKVCAREYANRYREDNKEYFSDYYKKWSKENPEKIKGYYLKHRKWKRDGLHLIPKVMLGRGEWIHLEEANKIMEAFNYSCVYCGVHKDKLEFKLGFDHIIPYVDGGKGVKENLVPCCKYCNSAKGRKEWIIEDKINMINIKHPYRE